MGIFVVLIILAVSFVAEGGVVWVLCWALKAVGITTIGSWTVAFSWPLVLIVWLVSWFLRSIFSKSREKG